MTSAKEFLFSPVFVCWLVSQQYYTETVKQICLTLGECSPPRVVTDLGTMAEVNALLIASLLHKLSNLLLQYLYIYT